MVRSDTVSGAPSCRPKLVIESLRGVPHSYALINHYQCLELLRREDIELYHLDVPYPNTRWRRAVGLFDSSAESAVGSIPSPGGITIPDAVVRLSFPYNYGRSDSPRLFVFGTAERYSVADSSVTGNRSLRAALADNPTAQILTPSRWSRDGFEYSGAPADRIHIVPHGVDATVYKPLPEDQREALRTSKGQRSFCFLHVGAMTTNKGVLALLRATAAVAARHPDIQLVLKGIDQLYLCQDWLMSQINELTEAETNILAPRLYYKGETLADIRMAEMYQIADAYVTPYEAEGFNLPALEAAASGMPVIATSGGSTDDFLRDDFALRIPAKIVDEVYEGVPSRRLVPDLDALIAHMLAVIENPEMRRRVREAGPRFINQNFTWCQVVDRLVQVILPELAAGGGGR